MAHKTSPETDEQRRIREDTEAVASIYSDAIMWKHTARELQWRLDEAGEREAQLRREKTDIEAQLIVARRAITINADPSWILWLDRLRAAGWTDNQINSSLTFLVRLLEEHRRK